MTRPIAVLTALTVAIVSAAAAGMLPITLDELKVDGWKVADGPDNWTGDAVREKIGDATDLYKGYNLIDSQWALLKSGERELDVFVFTCDTTANAYGLFSVLRGTMVDTAAESVDVGDEALYGSDGALLAWVGRCCITLTTKSADPPARKAFVRIAAQLASQVQGKAPRPELVEKLPPEGLSEASITYGHYRNDFDRVSGIGNGNGLGLGEDVDVPTGVEAVYGRYAIDDRPHDLLAIRYPEAAAAEKAQQDFAAALSPGAQSDTTDGVWSDIGGGDGTHTLTYRSGNLLAVAPNAVAVDKMKAIIREMSSGLFQAAVPPEPIVYRG